MFFEIAMKFKFFLIILCFSLISTWLILTGCTSTYDHVNYPVNHPANPNASVNQPIGNSGLQTADPIEHQMTERLNITPGSEKEVHQHHEGSHH